MNEELNMIFDMAKESMLESISHLNKELLKIRAGKATPAMLGGVRVDYYGSSTPLGQVANVNTPDARTLTVQPWEKSMLQEIEKAIVNANLGLNPQNNGDVIIINVPALTEERRRDLLKQAKAVGEHAKVGIRNSRKEANSEIKNLQKEGLPEDNSKDAEAEIQKITNMYNTKIDSVLDEKEIDIMTV
jgi:ribosome recycling factor|tara:strand:- start:645 stop:1208 length:564 start_codon:yes stop_codon:yes gene_type:complete